MGHAVLPGNPPIDITLRRSGRARRLSLRVSGLDGRVTLTLPPRVTETEALRFARSREGWIRKALEGQERPAPVVAGTQLIVAGKEMAVTEGPRPRLGEGAIQVAPGRSAGPQVAALLKALARERVVAAADLHAARLGRPYGRVTVRDTRSRWGSCSPAGDLMLSWRLILAPPDVLDYVVAHEVAHLEHMDHSAAFWSVVARLRPDFEEPRSWLRHNGQGLHRWRFAD